MKAGFDILKCSKQSNLLRTILWRKKNNFKNLQFSQKSYTRPFFVFDRYTNLRVAFKKGQNSAIVCHCIRLNARLVWVFPYSSIPYVADYLLWLTAEMFYDLPLKRIYTHIFSPVNNRFGYLLWEPTFSLYLCPIRFSLLWQQYFQSESSEK